MSDTKHILLVDDDVDDQFMFTYAMKEINSEIDCECVNNAESALETLKQDRSKFDYIFIDLNLPLMDGFTCLENIKSQQTLQQIPVVIYSTSSRPQDVERAKELGAADYIQKPGTFNELIDMIKKVLTFLYSLYIPLIAIF